MWHKNQQDHQISIEIIQHQGAIPHLEILLTDVLLLEHRYALHQGVQVEEVEPPDAN